MASPTEPICYRYGIMNSTKTTPLEQHQAADMSPCTVWMWSRTDSTTYGTSNDKENETDAVTYESQR